MSTKKSSKRVLSDKVAKVKSPKTLPASPKVPFDKQGKEKPEPQTPEEKQKAKESRRYFNAATQQAICDYQDAVGNLKLRQKIYMEGILPAFTKLVENLINIYHFHGVFDTYEDLRNDCITFLFETICKFDRTRGTNAFSYYNIIAKHWLIIRTKQRSTYVKRMVSLDDYDILTNHDHRLIEEICTVPGQDTLFENERVAVDIVDMLYGVRDTVATENELSCINSIITVFENIKDIDLLNKSAILLYMRELSGLSPKQLTTALANVKRAFKQMKLEEDEEYDVNIDINVDCDQWGRQLTCSINGTA